MDCWIFAAVSFRVGRGGPRGCRATAWASGASGENGSSELLKRLTRIWRWERAFVRNIGVLTFIYLDSAIAMYYSRFYWNQSSLVRKPVRERVVCNRDCSSVAEVWRRFLNGGILHLRSMEWACVGGFVVLFLAEFRRILHIFWCRNHCWTFTQFPRLGLGLWGEYTRNFKLFFSDGEDYTSVF